ncbi:epsilon family phenol-soluble modulin [Staphylococcus warneri]
MQFITDLIKKAVDFFKGLYDNK